MTQGKSLSVLDIAQELNFGKATIKFILRRFKNRLPYELINGVPYYLPETIKTIINIFDSLEAGMLPGEIEKCLDTLSNSDPDPTLNPSIKILQDEDIHLNKEGAVLLKSLFSELTEQQKRIAIAHEKRAAAEERKAVAIEKRAEAEERKAEAMNNIANALQEMNRFRGGSIEPVAQKIAHHAVEALIIDETDETDTTSKINNVDDGLKASNVFEKTIADRTDFIEIDDLSLLLENGFQDKKNLPDSLDDLSALIENNSKPENIEIDDLSALLDTELSESPEIEKLDDLSKLITPPDTVMDDLSKLVDPDETIQSILPEKEGISDVRTIEIDVSPNDIEKYKATIMKVILGLKTDGFSAEETTLMMNKNKIQTLSGKPEWSQKAISQIYKFMTSVT